LFCFVLFLEIVTRFVARCCKGLFAKFNRKDSAFLLF
jgi:hypothetical protein